MERAWLDQQQQERLYHAEEKIEREAEALRFKLEMMDWCDYMTRY